MKKKPWKKCRPKKISPEKGVWKKNAGRTFSIVWCGWDCSVDSIDRKLFKVQRPSVEFSSIPLINLL